MVTAARRARCQGGYSLVVLVVMVAVLQIAIAAALPKWSQVDQRQKEAELVFRGLQYAEAIRIFQARFGRYPVRLEELIEVEPRSIRRLWKDPMTESGEWELMLVSAATSARNQRLQGGADGRGASLSSGRLGAGRPGTPSDGRDDEDDEEEDEEDDGDRGNRRRRRSGSAFGEPEQTLGPIIGVQSRSKEPSIRTFFGASRYSEWRFTAELLPSSPGPIGDGNLPRLHTAWLGRAFPEGVEPQEGSAPGVEDGSAPGVEDGTGRRRRGPAESQTRRGRRRRGGGGGG